MGVTLSAKRNPSRSIDLGYFGFSRLRKTVSDLVGEPWKSHYDCLYHREVVTDDFLNAFDNKTEELIKSKKVSVKVVDFLLQSDTNGAIHYGACKTLLKLIGNYDDDILYGYAAHKNCAKFKDFKELLQECVEKKCDLIWQ